MLYTNTKFYPRTVGEELARTVWLVEEEEAVDIRKRRRIPQYLLLSVCLGVCVCVCLCTRLKTVLVDFHFSCRCRSVTTTVLVPLGFFRT